MTTLSTLVQTLDTMSGEPLRCKVTIRNPQGFHMRPMTAFVQLAGKFQSTVFVYNQDNKRFDGKSAFSLLGLGAEQGAEVFLEVCGPDQQAALEVLAELLASDYDYEAETD